MSCIEIKVVSLSILYFYLLGILIFKKDVLLFVNKCMYVFVLESIFWFLFRIKKEYINELLEWDIFELLLDNFNFIVGFWFFGWLDFFSWRKM